MDKVIRKKFLSKAQKCLIKAPAGLQNICHDEIQDIIKTSVQPFKFHPQVSVDESHVLVSEIDFRLVIEILLRSRLSRDLMLNIGQSRVGSFAELKDLINSIPWQFFFNDGEKISPRVQSFASYLYHEGKLRDILRSSLEKNNFQIDDEGIALQLTIKDNRAGIYLSLAGAPLYKRGIKKDLHTKAPLAEHLAAALMYRYKEEVCDHVLIPFAGSGTLGFEYLMQHNSVSPCNLGREYAIQKMPCCPQKTFQFLIETLKPTSEPREIASYTYIEQDAAQVEQLHHDMSGFLKNLNWNIPWTLINQDIFLSDLENLRDKNILLLMNPPYGLRLKPGNVDKFYTELADWVLKIFTITAKTKGFCLMASDRAYSIFRQRLGSYYQHTQHLNQGGIHVRAVYFANN